MPLPPAVPALPGPLLPHRNAGSLRSSSRTMIPSRHLTARRYHHRQAPPGLAAPSPPFPPFPARVVLASMVTVESWRRRRTIRRRRNRRCHPPASWPWPPPATRTALAVCRRRPAVSQATHPPPPPPPPPVPDPVLPLPAIGAKVARAASEVPALAAALLPPGLPEPPHHLWSVAWSPRQPPAPPGRRYRRPLPVGGTWFAPVPTGLTVLSGVIAVRCHHVAAGSRPTRRSGWPPEPGRNAVIALGVAHRPLAGACWGTDGVETAGTGDAGRRRDVELWTSTVEPVARTPWALEPAPDAVPGSDRQAL